jgi:hypothetical protein
MFKNMFIQRVKRTGEGERKWDNGITDKEFIDATVSVLREP